MRVPVSYLLQVKGSWGNHCYAIALHFVYYNFAKIHKSLSVTPAMQAGAMDWWMEISDIVKLTRKYNHNI